MNTIKTGREFYVVGGTMRPEASSYVEREADHELYRHVLAGDFCYVLTPRQMGKSSLMVHTARRLHLHDVRTVFVDLTLIGTEKAEQSADKWYYGIARTILRDLKIAEDFADWWREREDISALQRLVEVFSDLVLKNVSGRIVIFIDEIDTTIGLPFTDDFFAAIRACYNFRVTQDDYERLSFVLLGVASPSDLIKDPRRTPFNIGSSIYLTDFTLEEARPLAAGLSLKAQEGEQILQYVLSWTNGHPYLTQKLCHLIVESSFNGCRQADVDHLVEKHFLSPKAYREESNLNFVGDRLTKDKEHSREILKVYERISRDEIVVDNPLSPALTALKLSGLVLPNEYRQLRVRNRLYSQAFTTAWCRKAQQDLNEDLLIWKEQSRDLLALISKVGVTLLSSESLSETLEQIVSLVFDAVPADRCLIMMRDEHSPELRVAVARLRDRAGEVGEIRISRSVFEEVVTLGKSVLTSDAQADPRFASGTVIMQGVRSVLAVPLGVGEDVFGIIYADSPMAEGRFTEDHLKVLTTLASVAAIRVENARLAEASLQQERLEQELALAGEIQQRFQPAAPPIIKGYELQGISYPSYEIGADYYDFIKVDERHLVVALGDVSGKGTPAALLMSSLHASIHSAIEHVFKTSREDVDVSIVETVSAVNRYLSENIPPNRFITLFYAVLDVETGALVYVNAGHNPAMLVRADGQAEYLSGPDNLPLGIKPDALFRDERTYLDPGDVLVIFSDGVSEAADSRGDEFGQSRIYDAVLRNLSAPAASIRSGIESSLTQFTQGTPASDDLTLIIVKRTATASGDKLAKAKAK